MAPLASASPTSTTATPASATGAGAAGATAAFGRARAPPRDGPVASRLGVVVPRGGDGRGCEARLATARTLPADAAVGLLSRERSTFRGTLGGSGGGGALRDLASEAAVGANRPEEGVVGREGREVVAAAAAAAAAAAEAAFFDDGVFGREPGVAIATCVGDLALMLAAVERGRVGGVLRIPVPFEGVLRGVGVLERVARVVGVAVAVVVVVVGRVPGDDVDFVGDVGVLADFVGAVYGRDVEGGADARSLVGFVTVYNAGTGTGMGAGIGTGTGAGAGAGASCAVMDPLSSPVGPGAAGDSDLGADDAPSSDVEGTDAMAEVVEVPRSNVGAEEGGLELVLVVVPLAAAVALPFVLTGGHSRAMRCSSFTASLVLFEVTLVARDGGPDDDEGWRFCCCSKRPMRFATDWRGRSSGSGLLQEAARRIRRSDGKINT